MSQSTPSISWSRLFGAGLWPLVALLAATAALLGRAATRPALHDDFLYDRPDLPRVLRGFYPNERAANGVTFAWTYPTAELRFVGLDRGIPWTFRIQFTGTGARTPESSHVVFMVDDVVAAQVESSPRPTDLTLSIAPRRQPGLVIALKAPAVVPGSQDSRQLGIQVDAITLQPASIPASVGVWPTRATWQWSLWMALAVGLLLALARIGVAASASILVGLTWWQSLLLTRGLAPFDAVYGSRVIVWTTIACGLAALLLLASRTRTRATNEPDWPLDLRCALVLTVICFVAKLLVLAHPGMIQGDSMFHVNRLRLVLRGVYYFTSDAPGGPFPYPVALYVIASWLTSLTTDYIWLLRSIVLAADALAGLAVFAMAAIVGRSSRVAWLAVLLYHLVPAAFQVQAVAYLTNAFGQAMSVLACGALLWLSIGARPRWQIWAAWGTAIASLATAMLSHVSTCLFLVMQCMLWLGIRVTRETRLTASSTLPADAAKPPRSLLAGSAVAIALALATVLYYGHFWSLYQARLVSPTIAKKTTEATRPEMIPVQRDEAHQTRWAPGWPALRQRLTAVPRYATKYFGLPLILAAMVGTWFLWHAPANVGTQLIIAWLTTFAIYLTLGLFTPLDIRSYLAVSPALAILGALAIARAWASPLLKAANVTALAWCIQNGLAYWLAWFGDHLPR